MCGIVAVIGCGDPESLDRMTDLQAHRGPDDRGTWSTNHPDAGFLGLGSRRLAIRDLSPAGHMPMSIEEAGLHLVYNGELYNAGPIRSELESTGVRFRGHSDTEVILHALARWGPEAVSRFEGMFAFALLDLEGRLPGLGGGSGPALLVARDGFGVKPMYLRVHAGTLAVVSEAKSLLALPGFRAEVDPVALQRYLTFLWVPEPESMFAGVTKLPAGHWGVFRNGRLQVAQYAEAGRPGSAPIGSRQEETERVAELFDRAVSRQMVSDVPVGAFLSAGVDSTAIVARMAAASDRPIRTFTVAFPDEVRAGEISLDDPSVAARTAERFGCEHTEIVVEPNVVETLPRLIWHADDPIGDPAVLTAFSVCEQARDRATVLLSGIGGDELYAGYRKHVALRMHGAWRRIPSIVRDRILGPAVEALPGMRGTPFMGTVRLAKKWVRTASADPLDAFLAMSRYYDAGNRDALTRRNDLRGTLDYDVWDIHRGWLARSRGADDVTRALHLDLNVFMPSLSLLYNDRMSMANSVEIRVPFLDRDLVDHAFRLPTAWKLGGGVRPRTKSIFRDAMAGDLPTEVLRQKKAGFGGPHDHWLAHDLREMVDDLLSVRQIRERGFFEPTEVRRIIEAHRSGRPDLAYHVWLFLALELWSRAYLDG